VSKPTLSRHARLQSQFGRHQRAKLNDCGLQRNLSHDSVALGISQHHRHPSVAQETTASPSKIGAIDEHYFGNLSALNRRDSFQNTGATRQFWQKLAQSCLRLRAISFGTRDQANDSESLGHLFPVALFLHVESFGIESRCIAKYDSTWRDLYTLHRTKNRLTAWEIVGYSLFGKEQCRQRDAVLRHFLCSSPRIEDSPSVS